MSRANTIIILALSVTALLWIVKYQIQYDFNSRGADLQQTQIETEKYRQENQALKLEILHKEALTTINQEARAEGFVNAQIVYLR